MNLQQRLDYLELSDRELREQLGSAIDTMVKLNEKTREVRDKLATYIRVRGYVEDELVEIFRDISRLSGRTRDCPLDTNGDGDCGRRYCPHCGEASPVTQTTLDTPL